MYAPRDSQLEMVQLCLQRYPDIALIKNDERLTALDIVMYRRDIVMINANDVKTAYSNKFDISELYDSIQYNPFMPVTDVVVYEKELAVIESFLSQNVTHYEHLFWAAINRSDVEIVKCFIKYGSIKVFETPLNLILHSVSDVNVARCLLQREPSLIDSRNGAGDTVLHAMCSRFYPSLELIEFIVQYKPTLVETKNFHREYPLDYVRKKGLATPLDVALMFNNHNCAHVLQMHMPLDETIASHNDKRIAMCNDATSRNAFDAWLLEQCAFLNTVLLPDLTFLMLTYLGAQPKKQKAMYLEN